MKRPPGTSRGSILALVSSLALSCTASDAMFETVDALPPPQASAAKDAQAVLDSQPGQGNSNRTDGPSDPDGGTDGRAQTDAAGSDTATSDAPGRAPGLDDPCDNKPSFTARSVIAALQAEYNAFLTYQSTGPNPNVTEMTLRPSYDGGAIVCTPGFDPPPGSAGPSRLASLTIEIQLGVRTSDRNFAEQMSGKIESWAGANGVDLDARIKQEDIKGDLPPLPPPFTDVSISLSGMFKGTTTEGYVERLYSVENDRKRAAMGVW